jgi:hypothetical protein
MHEDAQRTVEVSRNTNFRALSVFVLLTKHLRNLYMYIYAHIFQVGERERDIPRVGAVDVLPKT